MSDPCEAQIGDIVVSEHLYVVVDVWCGILVMLSIEVGDEGDADRRHYAPHWRLRKVFLPLPSMRQVADRQLAHYRSSSAGISR